MLAGVEDGLRLLPPGQGTIDRRYLHEIGTGPYYMENVHWDGWRTQRIAAVGVEGNRATIEARRSGPRSKKIVTSWGT
jgi:hypothetical protein